MRCNLSLMSSSLIRHWRIHTHLFCDTTRAQYRIGFPIKDNSEFKGLVMILGTAASTPTSPSTLQQHPGAEILYVPKNASVGLEKDLWLFSPISGYIPSPTLPCPLSPPSSCKAPFAGITHKKPHRQMPGQKNTTAFPSCVFRNTLSRERWAWSCLCCVFSPGVGITWNLSLVPPKDPCGCHFSGNIPGFVLSSD